MRSTRAVLKSVDAARYKAQTLFQPRSQWDTLTSAFATTLSILSSQSDRDKFVETVNKGVINPSILGQSNMGLFKTLALYHDLNNELIQKHEFDIEDFLETAEPALERFNDVIHSFTKEELPGFTKAMNKVAKEEKVPESKAAVKSMAEVMKMFQQVQDLEKALIEETGGWNDVVEEENSESFHAQLQAMVSDQLMKKYETSNLQTSIIDYLNSERKQQHFVADSGEIQDITLLSASVHEMNADDNDDNADNADKNEDSDGYLVDESLEPGIEKGFNVPIVLQIEILYTITRILELPEKEDGEDVDADVNENSSLTNAEVVVFEGLLSDGTDSSDNSLCWKLVDHRPAAEFPGLTKLPSQISH